MTMSNEDIQPAELRVQFRVKFKLTGLTLMDSGCSNKTDWCDRRPGVANYTADCC